MAHPKLLTAGARPKMNRARLHANMRGQARDLFEDYPKECARYGDGPEDLHPLLCDFVDEIRAAGIKDSDLRARAMIIAFITYPEPWPAFIRQPFWEEVRRRPADAEDLFRDYCALLKLAASRGADIPVWW